MHPAKYNRNHVNPFSIVIQRHFNSLGREAIRSGAQEIPVMVDGEGGRISQMKVTKKFDNHAMLDRNGESFGVIF